jgi:hypothetical protein
MTHQVKVQEDVWEWLCRRAGNGKPNVIVHGILVAAMERDTERQHSVNALAEELVEELVKEPVKAPGSAPSQGISAIIRDTPQKTNAMVANHSTSEKAPRPAYVHWDCYAPSLVEEGEHPTPFLAQLDRTICWKCNGKIMAGETLVAFTPRRRS